MPFRCGLWGTKYIIRGKVMASPKSRPWVSLVSPSCPWLLLAPKVLQLCTNHLVLVLCKPVWVNEACQFFRVPSRSSNTPLYPSKVLRTKKHAPIPCYFVLFCLGLTFESLKELGARHAITFQNNFQRLKNRLLNVREEKIAKVEGKKNS